MTGNIVSLAHVAAPSIASVAYVETRVTLKMNIGASDAKKINEKTPDSQNDPARQEFSNALTDLGSRRLSILQDPESQHIVYRRIDSRTNVVEHQFPSEQELARVAFLREAVGHVLDATV